MTSPSAHRFRPDIEGMRALAILLALVYHARVPWATGGFVGVDVFFVISGFLITGLLIRELESTGRISLLNFWARRAKRLLPASLLVLLVTAIGTWLVVPNTSWRSIGSDIAAASVYVVNWRFALQSVDYNAQGAGVSPILHYWSLAVEEQYYIVWPLLLALLGAFVLKKVAREKHRMWFGIALAVIAIPSFIWSVYYTGRNPSASFFVTTTRLWELGIGAAVAIGAALWPRLSRKIAVPLGWLGLALILGAAAVFDGPKTWPGAYALAPVLGTAALIIATTGQAATGLSIGKLFSWRPMVWIGGLSYSWYLWHWPLLVLAEAHFGELRVGWALLVILISGGFAWLSLKLVENPIRYSKGLAKRSGLTASIGVNMSLIGIVAGLVLVMVTPGATSTVADPSTLGARSLSTDRAANARIWERDSVEFMVPVPANARDDVPENDSPCRTPMTSSDVVTCEWGDPNGDIVVAAAGDSKIAQMETALTAIAEERGWRIVTFFKSGCAFADPILPQVDDQSRSCAEWSVAALDAIVELDPDVMITTSRGTKRWRTEDGAPTPGAEALAAWWSELIEADIPVIPILDNPAPPFEFQVDECVARNPNEISVCAFERELALEDSGAYYERAAMEIVGITDHVDLAEYVCPVGEKCPAVIGNVLVYRQGSHLTDTYVETLTEVMDERLGPLVEAAARR